MKLPVPAQPNHGSHLVVDAHPITRKPITPEVTTMGRCCDSSSVARPPNGRFGSERHHHRGPPSEMEECIWALLHTEVSYRTNFLPVRRRPTEWRRKIGQWAYRVIDHFGVDRQVVGIAMNLMDRFLLRTDDIDSASTANATNSRNYQLSAMTCLYLALKLHTRHYKRHLRILAELSRGQFIVDDILDMEHIVLETLDWRVHPPTPMTFVQCFLQYHQQQQQQQLHQQQQQQQYIEYKDETRSDTEEPSSISSSSSATSASFSPWQVVQEIARYCTELAVLECQQQSYASPSQLAYACIVAAMDVLTEDALSTNERDAFCDHLVPFVPPGKSTSRLHQHLTSLISVAELLLVSEHHTSHPIAKAWGLSWLRCNKDTAAHTTTSKLVTTTTPSTPVQRSNNSNNNNNIYTTESPVSVL